MRRLEPNRPVDELQKGQRFYETALPDLDVSHFGAMWHLVTVGHLVLSNLDRIARTRDLGIADLHLLGTLNINGPRPMRATDLARSLYVSNAVLSSRVRRLLARGLIDRKS